MCVSMRAQHTGAAASPKYSMVLEKGWKVPAQSRPTTPSAWGLGPGERRWLTPVQARRLSQGRQKAEPVGQPARLSQEGRANCQH